MPRRIYLDHNATTPTHPAVLESMLPYFTERFGNPSSVYKRAKESRRAVKEAREKVAKLIGADPVEMIFTSGGTESDNTALKGVAFALSDRGNHIVTSQIEHHAVLHCCRWLEKHGFDVTYVGVDHKGRIDPSEIAAALTDRTILVSIMHANNETGVIQPLSQIASVLREKNIFFHTDAVQSVGKIPVNVGELGVDLLSLSGHKIYGPKGVGALYKRKGTKITSLLQGGGHERNMRSGTENVPGIVGLGMASEIALREMKENAAKERELRDRLERGVLDRIPDIVVNSQGTERLPGTLNFCVKYVEGESILLHLDARGIEASSGSACTSGSLEPSHVLGAMGVPVEMAHGSLRFSIGRSNTREDIDFLLEVLPPVVEKLRAMSPMRT